MKNYNLIITFLISVCVSSTGISYANDPFLSHFVPKTIEDTYRGEAFNNDLSLSNSNANSIFCLHYKKNDFTAATLIATRTFEEVYNLPSKINYRYGNKELIELYTIAVDQLEFTIGMYVDNGELFYNCSFALEYNNPASFKLINAFTEARIKSNHHALNYDITAKTESSVISFIEGMLSILSEQSSIIQEASDKFPNLSVKHISYKNGRTKIEFLNVQEALTIEIKNSNNKTENGVWNEDSSQIIEISPIQKEVELSGFCHEGLIEIWLDNQMVDKAYHCDGVWKINNEDDLFHHKINQQVEAYTDAQLIERSVVMVSKLLNPAILERSVFMAPEALLSYNYLSLEIEGIKEITIDIIDNTNAKYSLSKSNLEDGQIDFKLADFTNLNNEPFHLQNLKTLQFKIEGQKQAYPMQIENLRFSQQIILNNQEVDTKEININLYPNPSSDFVHIETHNEKIEQVLVINGKGRTVLQTYNLKTIDVRNFVPGLYTIQVKTKNQLKNKKILVL